MLDRIEHAVLGQRRLIADASHELRRPLAAMCSEIDVSLRADELPSAASAVLASAREEEVDSMSRAVEDLLTLAAADEGVSIIAAEPADLGHIAAAVVDALRGWAAERGVGAGGPRPGAHTRRPGAAAPRRAQPRREREPLHLGRRAGSRQPPPAIPRPRSRSAMPAQGSRPICASESSTASSAPTPHADAPRAAAASAWQSRATSPKRTADALASGRCRTGAPSWSAVPLAPDAPPERALGSAVGRAARAG